MYKANGAVEFMVVAFCPYDVIVCGIRRGCGSPVAGAAFAVLTASFVPAGSSLPGETVARSRQSNIFLPEALLCRMYRFTR